MIKAIIFDFGGPIVEWEAGADVVFHKHEAHHNIQRDTLHKLFNEYFVGGHVGDFHSVTDFYEKTKPSISMTIEELNEVFDETSAAMRVRPEMIAYIGELKKKYKIALLSNFTSGIEKFLEEIFKINHLFDVVVSSYNVKMKKPDPRIYEHALKELGVQPREAIFIDDLEENIEGAKAVGIRSIIFRSADQCMADLDELL